MGGYCRGVSLVVCTLYSGTVCTSVTCGDNVHNV